MFKQWKQTYHVLFRKFLWCPTNTTYIDDSSWSHSRCLYRVLWTILRKIETRKKRDYNYPGISEWKKYNLSKNKQSNQLPSFLTFHLSNISKMKFFNIYHKWDVGQLLPSSTQKLFQNNVLPLRRMLLLNVVAYLASENERVAALSFPLAIVATSLPQVTLSSMTHCKGTSVWWLLSHFYAVDLIWRAWRRICCWRLVYSCRLLTKRFLNTRPTADSRPEMRKSR